MSNGHVCAMCAQRGKTWDGDDPVCAFDTAGKFNASNWNCATMNKLREIADGYGLRIRHDMAAASIGCVPFEGDDYSGYIVMTWYKDRGRTGNAFIAWDAEPVREFTYTDAVAAIAQYARKEVA